MPRVLLLLAAVLAMPPTATAVTTTDSETRCVDVYSAPTISLEEDRTAAPVVLDVVEACVATRLTRHVTPASRDASTASNIDVGEYAPKPSRVTDRTCITEVADRAYYDVYRYTCSDRSCVAQVLDDTKPRSNMERVGIGA